MRRILFVVSLAACGGGGSGTSPPTGPHFTYVADSVTVPKNNTEARMIGLDLNGDKTIDNQLGMVLGTLASQGFKVQETLTLAVDQGSIILLIDFQSPNFTSTNGAGLAVELGAMPMPPACNGSADTTCRHHLDGNGSFTVDPNSPTDAVVDGKIAGGVFSGGDDKTQISLEIALGGTEPIALNLIGARAKATGLAETGLDNVILAGALTKNDLDTKVIPAVQAQIAPLITRDCTMLTSPPDCGCGAGTTGKTVIGLFDTSPKDCMVTVDEIKTNSLIQSLLAPDVTIDGQDALSLGIQVHTVKATLR